MRRYFELALVFLLIPVASCTSNQPTQAGRFSSADISICQKTSDSSFELLEIERSEFADHLGRGDGVPFGPVPQNAGLVFSASCEMVPDTDAGACPIGMANIDGFCIDRWEAHLEGQSPFLVPDSGTAVTAPTVVPQGYISAEVASAACQAAGKRLCTSSEWIRSCRGYDPSTFPYGNTYIASACNEGRVVHPVIELFGSSVDWSSTQMNDPRINQLPNSLNPTGSTNVCMTEEGVFDMHGNLHEWVSDSDGKFRGGFYVDARINGEGCSYVTTAHGRGYHDYSTGFRCCADAN